MLSGITTSRKVLWKTRVKILWDFDIQTDHVIQHRRPDIVIVYKKERKCQLIDIAIPGERRVELKEHEKVDNYNKLKREVKKIWSLTYVNIVSIIVGALGTTPKNLKDWLGELELKISIELFQKAVLLGTAKIVRKVLDT